MSYLSSPFFRLFISVVIFLFVCDSYSQIGETDVHMQIDSLIELSKKELSSRKVEKANLISNQAKQLAYDKLGKESIGYAKTIFNEARIFYVKKEYSEALILLDSVLHIVKKRDGEKNEFYCNALIRTGRNFSKNKNYDEAENSYLRVKKLLEEVNGRESETYQNFVYDLGSFYDYWLKYEKTEKLFLEYNQLIEEFHGKNNELYSKSLKRLVELYYKSEKLVEAEKLANENIELTANLYGTNHITYSKALDGIARIHVWNNKLEQAEQLFNEGIRITADSLGADHPDGASRLVNIAIVYKRMGKYKLAEKYYRKTISIIENLKGYERTYAITLYNLGGLCGILNRNKEKEKLLYKAAGIHERFNDTLSRDYANVLHGLSHTHSYNNEIDEAIELIEKANKIRFSLYGKRHTFYSSGLMSLSQFYSKKEDYILSEKYANQALAIVDSILGKDHTEYADILNYLGNIKFDQGQYDNIEPLWLRAKEIFLNQKGEDYIDYILMLRQLAKLNAKLGKDEIAQNYYIEHSPLLYDNIMKATLYMSEYELSQYVDKFKNIFNTSFSFAADYPSQEMKILSYNDILFYKGYLLNVVNKIRRITQGDPNSTDKLIELKTLKRILNKLYAVSMADREMSKIDSIENKASILEREILASVGGLDILRKRVEWTDVQSKLENNECAIEFVSYKPNEEEHTSYAALVLKNGWTEPKLVSLFQDDVLKRIMSAESSRKAQYVENLYASADRGLITEEEKVSLYELIWAPLKEELTGVSTIFFASTGLLHRLNLGAIAIDEELCVLDKYNLIEMNSTRQLVEQDDKTYGNIAVVYGGITYDSVNINTTKEAPQIIANVSSPNISLGIGRNITSDGERWNYLRWTAKEKTYVESILAENEYSVNSYEGVFASEESIKNIDQTAKSPSVLHLATHGYFFDPIDYKTNPDSTQNNWFRNNNQPMLRSGLIMAGGNRTWITGSADNENMEDGILSAYEISQLDLSNTELVVLSACETGLGDIKGNEGVYGLQRAFKIAGAKYIVMSLWQVPDRETSEFMKSFYKSWLEDELSIPDAFMKAQLEMRDRFFNPYQWAGFILVK